MKYAAKIVRMYGVVPWSRFRALNENVRALPPLIAKEYGIVPAKDLVLQVSGAVIPAFDNGAH
jgi:hypothetical protein